MKVQFLTQKFTDFAGVERSFTVAAFQKIMYLFQ